MSERSNQLIRWSAVLLTAAAASAGSAAAQSYSAVNDWSTTNNPNGVWNYGYSDVLGGPVTLYNVNANPCPIGGEPQGIDCWNLSNVPGPHGGIAHNGTGSFSNTPAYNLPTNELEETPFFTNTVLRWTAPTAGFLNVSGFFDSCNTSSTPGGVFVLENGVAIFSHYVTGNLQAECAANPLTPFSFTSLAVGAGNTIDFVTQAANQSYEGVNANLTLTSGAPITTPEPSSLALLGTGLVGLVPMMRRRRNNNANRQ